MNRAEARRRFSAGRVARLATVDESGNPHLVPIVFVVSGEMIYSAVDAKPKRSMALRRLANVAANPQVAVLVDHYEDSDWGALWWVRADGIGRVLQASDSEAHDAVAQLRQRYQQYREDPPTGPVLAVDVRHWSGWSASESADLPSSLG
jgi:PPOX class probable F420-dependent enzyme